MNYGNIKKTDIANGPGVRVSLFVSGCPNHCPGCFNKEAQDYSYGEPYTGHITDAVVLALYPSYISGLSVLGGEPLDPRNVETVTKLVRVVKAVFKNKTIWIYTGYLYEDVKDLEIMEYIDVLVDGPFIEDLKDVSLVFKGSSNQRIIDIPATRRSGDIKLWRSKKWS